ASPHSADAPVNSAIAASMTRLPPYRSPSQPDAGMVTARLTRKAIEMPSTAVALTPKSRPMVGRATLTIVASRVVMNIAATKTAPTATFWLIRGVTGFLSPRQRLACGFGTPPTTRSRTHRKFHRRRGRQRTEIPAPWRPDALEPGFHGVPGPARL